MTRRIAYLMLALLMLLLSAGGCSNEELSSPPADDNKSDSLSNANMTSDLLPTPPIQRLDAVDCANKAIPQCPFGQPCYVMGTVYFLDGSPAADVVVTIDTFCGGNTWCPAGNDITDEFGNFFACSWVWDGDTVRCCALNTIEIQENEGTVGMFFILTETYVGPPGKDPGILQDP